MLFVVLSIVILATAPAIERVFRHSKHFEQVLSGFILVVLGGIIFFDLLPLSFRIGGWPVIPLVILGLIGPTLIEKLFRQVADSTHQLTLMIGFSGLLLHTMVDGASLNEYKGFESASSWLPYAILIHRIPVALTVLWIMRPVFGLRAVWIALAALGTFTLFGYILGVQLESAMTSHSFAWLQAFVTGTLLHVLLHRPHRHSHQHTHSNIQQSQNDHPHNHHNHSHLSLLDSFKQWGRYQMIGAGLGAVSLYLLSLVHH